MNNYNFPKMNYVSQNLFQIPSGQNNNIIQPDQNQLNFPLGINQILLNNQNINQLLPILYPDQFLCQNQLYFFPRLLVLPQVNQINLLNQLLLEKNIINQNNMMNLNNMNNINNMYNGLLFNTPQLNNLNENILTNIINNNKNNEQIKDKEKNEIINHSPGKKFLITHDNLNPNLKTDINIINEKITSENNNIYLNQLKNSSSLNNNRPNQPLNEKPEENKDQKSKVSLFTTSIVDSNNTNPSPIKFQLQNSTEKPINEENNTQNNNNNANQNLFDLEHLEENKDKEKTKYYRCSFKECNKVFLKQSNLKDHIRTHTGEKPYICLHPGCGKTFSQHGNLKKHEKIHSGNKKYYCSYPNCGKKFSASYNLKIHYRCHTGEKPYKCNFPNCGREFYDKGNLKYHEKNMHALENMEYPYSCEHMGCNAKFKTKLEKLKHHSEMEIDCYKERKELIKLIQRYKIFLKKIIIKKGIDPDKNEIVLKLKKNYEDVQDKLIDKDLFNHYLGENFENECTNIEEINSDNEEKKEEKENLNGIKEKEEENNIDINKDNNNDEKNKVEKIEDKIVEEEVNSV